MKRKIIGCILVIILFMQVLMPVVLGAQIEQIDNDETEINTSENSGEKTQLEDTNTRSITDTDDVVEKEIQKI